MTVPPPGRLQTALAQTPPFSAIPEEERRRLLPHSRLRAYEKGETIFREGSDADRFQVVASGRVKIVKLAPLGREIILEIFGVGDPFGAVAVLEGLAYPASAVALEPVEVLGLSRADFFGLINRHPEVTRGLLLGLTRRLMEMTRRLAQLTAGGVEYRIASLFLKMSEGMGRQEAAGLVIPLALSRQEIADMVGTTIETAIRIMSRWNKEGIVLTERERFVIGNREVLERIVASV